MSAKGAQDDDIEEEVGEKKGSNEETTQENEEPEPVVSKSKSKQTESDDTPDNQDNQGKEEKQETEPEPAKKTTSEDTKTKSEDTKTKSEDTKTKSEDTKTKPVAKSKSETKSKTDTKTKTETKTKQEDKIDAADEKKTQADDTKDETNKGDAEESTASEAGGRKQRDFFREELKRLQNGLEEQKSKIQKPEVREYHPYVFTNLGPYFNTDVASYVIDIDDNQRQSYNTRQTAQGLCDPWVDLEMDHNSLPKLETYRANKPSTTESSRAQKNKRKSDKKRPPKEGSTHLPEFPKVKLKSSDNATKMFPYDEVPAFREELKEKFSQNATVQIERDYKRTKQDFYRMGLDRIDQVHPLNRPNMRKAYFAYLQNTPGSKKAIKECAKTLPA